MLGATQQEKTLLAPSSELRCASTTKKSYARHNKELCGTEFGAKCYNFCSVFQWEYTGYIRLIVLRRTRGTSNALPGPLVVMARSIWVESGLQGRRYVFK